METNCILDRSEKLYHARSYLFNIYFVFNEYVYNSILKSKYRKLGSIYIRCTTGIFQGSWSSKRRPRRNVRCPLADTPLHTLEDQAINYKHIKVI